MNKVRKAIQQLLHFSIILTITVGRANYYTSWVISSSYLRDACYVCAITNRWDFKIKYQYTCSHHELNEATDVMKSSLP